MAYKVIILYRLYMPSYFLGTFTEYPYVKKSCPFAQSLIEGYFRCPEPVLDLSDFG